MDLAIFLKKPFLNLTLSLSSLSSLRSQRRAKSLAEKGLLFVGSGVSGGEDGARYGPSLMPGGHPDAWPHVKAIFQGIAAKVGKEPCCDWVGEDGAGHYVKMVHNGIEYGDMQVRLRSCDFWTGIMCALLISLSLLLPFLFPPSIHSSSVKLTS